MSYDSIKKSKLSKQQIRLKYNLNPLAKESVIVSRKLKHKGMTKNSIKEIVNWNTVHHPLTTPIDYLLLKNHG